MPFFNSMNIYVVDTYFNLYLMATSNIMAEHVESLNTKVCLKGGGQTAAEAYYQKI